jgi:poly-gamma-glutamate synthesis protein (capsule biosynthesis protein)
VLLLAAFALSACQPLATATQRSTPLPVAATTPAPLPDPTPSPRRPHPHTLDGIFQQPPDLDGADAGRLRVLVATGDIIPARNTNWKVVTRNDFLYPYRATVDYLRQSDLLFVNLEAPLMASCPIIREGFKFCGDARHIQGLAYAKVSVASLANNHLTNYGPAGTNETIGLLNRNGIAPVGLGLWTVRDVRGIRFGFLAFNGVGERIDRAEVAREIGIVRPQADVLVVAFHWGKEYESLPQSAPGIAPDDPRALAHETIDLGADLIIGNHPHWVQGVELYHRGFVAYAHGNFIFDQSWSRETQEGVVGRYTFYDKELAAVEYRPVGIDDLAQPRFLQGDDAAHVLARMEDSSWLMAGPRPSPSPPRLPRAGAPG